MHLLGEVVGGTLVRALVPHPAGLVEDEDDRDNLEDQRDQPEIAVQLVPDSRAQKFRSREEGFEVAGDEDGRRAEDPPGEEQSYSCNK